MTKEDVAALLPTVSNPLEDPIFLIPPSGRHYSSHDDFEPAALVPLSTLQKGSRPPAHASLMKDRVSELKAQAAAEVNVPGASIHPGMTSVTLSLQGSRPACCRVRLFLTRRDSRQPASAVLMKDMVSELKA